MASFWMPSHTFLLALHPWLNRNEKQPVARKFSGVARGGLGATAPGGILWGGGKLMIES